MSLLGGGGGGGGGPVVTASLNIIPILYIDNFLFPGVILKIDRLNRLMKI